MRIALFGASGTIGRRIAAEALQRGHGVTAVVRDPTRFAKPADTLDVVKGDILDPASVAAAVRGQDAVISAVGPAHTGDVRPQMLVDAARSLIAGLQRAGVRRLGVVGGAGSLEVALGVQLVDTPGFMPGTRQWSQDEAALEPSRRDHQKTAWGVRCLVCCGKHRRTVPVEEGRVWSP